MTLSADILLIIALAVATYFTRIGGYLILSRFGTLGPRTTAALDAVPAAVMTAIVAPMALSGAAEALAATATVIAALRLPIHATLLVGAGTVVLLRATGL
jgi:uncharacterized membrane protein